MLKSDSAPGYLFGFAAQISFVTGHAAALSENSERAPQRCEHAHGCMDWNGGMEWWNGLDWTGMEWPDEIL